MKKTLLSLTQAVLNKMDSDEVNSIFDTVESTQVAEEIRDTFENMVTYNTDYHFESFGTLDSVANQANHFNQLAIPDNLAEIYEIWVQDLADTSQRYKLQYVSPGEFVDNMFKGTYTSTKSATPVGQNGPRIPIPNDRYPRCFTSFDQKHLFFDAVPTDVMDTIWAQSVFVRGRFVPEFKMEDTFIPTLPAEAFPELLSDAIDACHVHFKGVSNSKAQRRVRKQMVKRNAHREKVSNKINNISGPPYGRNSRGGSLLNRGGDGDTYS